MDTINLEDWVWFSKREDGKIEVVVSDKYENLNNFILDEKDRKDLLELLKK